MLGFAVFKSHILRRDEKGLFGIPFKRLLGCGLGGGFLMTVTKLLWPEWSVLIGAVTVIILLIFSAPRHGLPRWQHLLYAARWRLLTAARIAPHSMVGRLGHTLQLPIEALDVDGTQVFGQSEDDAPRTHLTDWVSFSQLSDVEKLPGLAVSRTPGIRSVHGEAA